MVLRMASHWSLLQLRWSVSHHLGAWDKVQPAEAMVPASPGSLALRWKISSLWLWGVGGHVAGGHSLLLHFLPWKRVSFTWAESSLCPSCWWPKGPSAKTPEEASRHSASPMWRLSHGQVFSHPLSWKYCRCGSRLWLKAQSHLRGCLRLCLLSRNSSSVDPS